MRTTLRERLSEVAGFYSTLEVALFTSFNFHADFFEQNVLPALFGAEPGTARAAREQLVHRGLLHTQVGVFYDPSAAKPGANSFRYTAYPIFVPGRLFHPKLILLFGRDRSGESWLYVASMSANLSLSGWGRNVEGFADTWIHSATEQPAKAVRELLEWLRQQSIPRNSKRDALISAISWLQGRLKPRRSRSDPEQGDWANKAETRLYISPSHTSMWQFVRTEYGAISNIRAASPYWGGTEAIAKELVGVPLQLTAAHCPPKMASVGLCQTTVDALMPDQRTHSKALSAWADDKARFRHLKLYEVRTARIGAVTGIGSCNFTVAGQFWKSSGLKPDGNVEAMLFDATVCKWDTQPLNFSDLPATDAGDPARPWPFYVAVDYDWREHSYAWHVQGELGDAVTLNLHDGGPQVRLSAASKAGAKKGTRFSHRYTVERLDPSSGELEIFAGIVREVNLDSSTQIYGTPLDVQDILDSWQSGADTEPPPPEPPGGQGDDTEKTPGPNANNEAEAAVPFDSFAFYQSLRKLKSKLEAIPSTSPGAMIDWLVGRSDSVAAMARAFSENRHSLSASWIVLTECEGLLKAAARQPQVAVVLDVVREALAMKRVLLIDQMLEQLAHRGGKCSDE